MLLLDLVNNCNNYAIANLFNIIQKAFNILQILVPIIAILALALHVVKSVTKPDDKKNFSRYKNWIIALVIIFALPTIVDTVMNILGENYSISACWNYASQIDTSGQTSTYNNGNDGDKSTIVTDPSDYDPATGTSLDDNSSSNNSSSTTTVGSGSVIFIGDSRTVQMKAHVGEGSDIWSCKGSMGLNWMQSTGVPNISSYIKSGSKIVILMGVNDLYQASSYITYINSKATEWSNLGATTYFVSVNPCDGGYSHLNDDIASFNSKLKSGLNSKVKYIDTNSYLNSSGFTTTDGLHYNQATSQKIYNYIKSKI